MREFLPMSITAPRGLSFTLILLRCKELTSSPAAKRALCTTQEAPKDFSCNPLFSVSSITSSLIFLN
jgi:hypothetical protein